MTTTGQKIRLLVASIFVLAFSGGCLLSAGVATPRVLSATAPGNVQGWTPGLAVNTAERRLEVHIFSGSWCLIGSGCLAEPIGVNQFVVRQRPAVQFFFDASMLSAYRMGTELTTQWIALPPGDYTAIYCVSYAQEFGCRSGWGPRIRHFRYDPRQFTHYQPYPYDPYLHRKIVSLPWRLDIGVPDDPPLRDFVGFWILFDLTCVREPWLCKGGEGK